MKTGIERIAAERKRQIEAEGWTPEHDDEHNGGEMAIAASIYAAPGYREGCKGNRNMRGKIIPFWPWDENWWKPTDRIRDLEKAGALIAAEIDRLQRLQSRDS